MPASRDRAAFHPDTGLPRTMISPVVGVIVVEEFPGHWQKLVALRVNRYERVNVIRAD